MGGGLLQLVAYGAQDAYLSGNPQITFWRGLYKRHTNFAMEPFRVNLTGQANWGVKHSAIVPRHADLITHAYLEVELPAYGKDTGDLRYGWSPTDLGFKMIKYVELDIGGQVIDRLYGEWLKIWSGLTESTETRGLLTTMISAPAQVTTDANCNGFGFKKLYIPLSFWFARNPGAALPLIALQYHEVKFNIVWNTSEYLTTNYARDGSDQTLAQQPIAPPAPRQANLLIDYVYLDVEERRRMAQESHEYLIEQVQFNEDKGITAQNTRVDLTFNHPVKELIWLLQETGNSNCKYTSSSNTTSPHAIGDTVFTYLGEDESYRYSLQINGQDRVPALEGKYYTYVQPYQHHTGTNPSKVMCYSFAIRPEEHQPSGTCNFSRIDTATLVVNMDTAIDRANNDSTLDCRVYAINYNVLRVMSGMAGLAYSN